MAAFSLGLSARIVMRFGIRWPLVGGLLRPRRPGPVRARAGRRQLRVHVLPGMLLLGLGAGIAFNPLLLAAMGEVAQSESGLASGVVNTSFMMGGALGLAVLASLAAAHTGGATSAGAASVTALSDGYRLAFAAGPRSRSRPRPWPPSCRCALRRRGARPRHERCPRRLRDAPRRDASGRADPRHAVSRQDVERAVEADQQVDRCAGQAGEGVGRVAVRQVDPADEAVAELGEVVLVAVAGGERAAARIERAADDGEAGEEAARTRSWRGGVAVLVGEQRRRDAGADVVRPFRLRPAVVRARDAEVDLLPGVLADVVDVDPARPGCTAKVNGLRRPDAQIARASPLCWRRTGCRRERAVVVEAQQLANGSARFCALAPLALSPTPT